MANIIDYSYMIRRIHPRQILHRVRKLSAARIEKIGFHRNKTTISNNKFFSAFRNDLRETIEIEDSAKEGEYLDSTKLLLNHMVERSNPSFFIEKDSLGKIKKIVNGNFSSTERSVVSNADKIINDPSYSFKLDDAGDNSALWAEKDKNGKEVVLGINAFRPFLFQLCKAYCYTEKVQYLQKAWDLICEWIAHTPLTNNVAWSSFAISRRLMEWMWAYNLLLHSRVISNDDNLIFLKSILLQTRRLFKRIEYDVMGNHLLLNAECLFWMGILFPEFTDSDKWVSKSLRILSEEIDNQVYDDGVHKEQSIHYHLFATNTFIEIILLARLNGVKINEKIECKAKKMVKFLARVMRPDGKIPLLGDSMWSNELSIQDVICYGSIMFTDEGLKRFAGISGFTEKALWLFGPTAFRTFNLLEVSSVIEKKDFIFKNTGYVISRNSWGKGAHYMVFDCGPFGLHQNPGHGHADALSIELCVFGKPLIVDPGVYTYEPGRWRSFFRGTSAHNTVEIDGIDQTPLWGAYKAGRMAKTQVKEYVSTDGYCLVCAEHDGYSRNNNPVFHQRQILFAMRKYWIIDDFFNGRGEHTFNTFFHFVPCHVRSEDNNVTAEMRNGINAAIYPVSLSNLHLQVSEGLTSPVQGWVSNVIYEKRPSPVATYTTEAKCPHRSLFVIYPTQDVDDNILSVTEIQSAPEGKLNGLTLETDEFVDYYITTLNSHQEYSIEDFVLKADTIFFHNERNSNAWELFSNNGFLVLKKNTFIVESDKGFKSIEMKRRNENLYLFTDNAANIKIWDTSISRVYLNNREISFSREVDCIHVTTLIN
ncbi:MAG: heparinase II/III family protein [Candidatus Scalindua rubra]|uniref:Uncharacterized protein n=1 Tax=Candidatus Scalindua brodae TaxID=237368 RepID=A0A0B0EFM0_9BACT|nr:MAG: hypothetical protein SCABRO_03390 [Candidatus Scalindua brodae]MBZ0108440.1 heparinase II/III family protein [Candidatus Scalindua rubra]TWU28800.1 Heparin-sulfate lyase precursor [Candidatus Brocadiaceae bacterium S225]